MTDTKPTIENASRQRCEINHITPVALHVTRDLDRHFMRRSL